jgi:hypothetical protein
MDDGLYNKIIYQHTTLCTVSYALEELRRSVFFFSFFLLMEEGAREYVKKSGVSSSSDCGPS